MSDQVESCSVCGERSCTTLGWMGRKPCGYLCMQHKDEWDRYVVSQGIALNGSNYEITAHEFLRSQKGK